MDNTIIFLAIPLGLVMKSAVFHPRMGVLVKVIQPWNIHGLQVLSGVLRFVQIVTPI